MAADPNPPLWKKKLLFWSILLGTLAFISFVALWRSSHRAPAENAPGLGFIIILTLLGGLSLAAAGIGYLGIYFTSCLTFDFRSPVYAGLKVRLYFANLVVRLVITLCGAFLAAAFISPVLAPFNLPGNTAFMLPVMASIVLLQILMVWVVLWSPLEKRVICQRLRARGLTKAQLQGGYYVGLSNPAITSDIKRWWGIEEDIGMLWITPEQIIYWGDAEGFGITRAQLLDAEQRADTKSTSVLSGTKHVILHVQLPDGNTRQIRLHTEGEWTLGAKRRASDALAARIQAWRTSPAPAAV